MKINFKQFCWFVSLVIILFNIGLAEGGIYVNSLLYYFIVVPVSLVIGGLSVWAYNKEKK